MKLKEYESKKLFQLVDIPISKGSLIAESKDIPPFNDVRLLKVQTLAGGRGKAGGVCLVRGADEARKLASRFLHSVFMGEQITEVLLDEKVEIAQELYLGVLFDTSTRKPVFIYSEAGGADIEELKKKQPTKIVLREIAYHEGLTAKDLSFLLKNSELEPKVKAKVKEVMTKLYTCFTRFDCRMLEINPLVVTSTKDVVAVDAVAVLDDEARFRWEIPFPERTNNRPVTKREAAAHEIDKDDYRGVAGKTFVDLDGDIAILTSGGGASMTLLDALVDYGGKPANFTEYSGNPPQEKVEKLTRIVLDKEKLAGLLVAGVIANFTNIAETLRGVLNVLIEKKPRFPIVIRRAGPHDEEARAMLMEAKAKYGLDIHYYDEKIPLTQAAKIMVDLSQQYKQQKGGY
ncbi:acetate--CoA ligase family protein [Candidatus Woesearchaeota archaeon]|nr:acetate--CoA ligase family protein [Candidatus Woesearchaeota archaeon]